MIKNKSHVKQFIFIIIYVHQYIHHMGLEYKLGKFTVYIQHVLYRVFIAL